jgi:alpha-tubulin suppressor-like RCC1 family protein
LALLGVAAVAQHLACELAFPTHLVASTPCTDADTASDDDNCGACGNACEAGVHCYLGMCGGGRVTQVSAGAHACALVKAGTVFCWGSNEFGETGSAPSTQSCGANACLSTPTEVPGLTGVVEVRAGYYSTCARIEQGTVSCWGQNAAGQLGHPPTMSTTCNGDCELIPRTVLGLSNVKAIDVGDLFACALDSTGALRCWGDNAHGELGSGSDAGSSSTPTTALLPAGATATAVSTGLDPHACALLGGGQIACWGQNHLGALGHDPATDPTCASNDVPCSGTPAAVNGVTGATAVRAGNGVTCALVGDGGVSCWGDDGLGQFGNGPVTSDGGVTFAPQAAAGGMSFRALDGRYDFTLALDAAGTVWAWGASSYGALGAGVVGAAPCENDGSPCQAVPARVTFPGAAAAITQVSAGVDFGLALDSNGAVWAWGANGTGQLGHLPEPDAGDRATCGPGQSESCNPTPTRVPGFP